VEEKMKRLFLVLSLTALALACGKDNSSKVNYAVDGSGCLIDARGYDWQQRDIADEGLITQNYRWDCADFTDIERDISVQERQVTLTFTGTTCLELTSVLVLSGYCVQGPTAAR